jgi:hypothetical protein
MKKVSESILEMIRPRRIEKIARIALGTILVASILAIGAQQVRAFPPCGLTQGCSGDSGYPILHYTCVVGIHGCQRLNRQFCGTATNYRYEWGDSGGPYTICSVTECVQNSNCVIEPGGG